MLPESVPVVGESSVPASSIVHTPRVPETTVSDMDSDNRDDVPLARLLKRTLIPDVSDKLPINPPSSIHSQKSLSIEGVFIPTSGILPATNIQLGSSARSPLSSPLPFTSIGAHESISDDVPGDISVAPVGQPNNRRDEDEVEP